MELIKPFLKYSKLYRQTADANVRRRIFNQWSFETNYRSAVANCSCVATIRCIFCHEYSLQCSEKEQFCTHCLFPLAGGADEEWVTYCLSSICFYESDTSEESHRTVYKQRLKMIWYEYERYDKVYEIIYFKCQQCNSDTSSSIVGLKFIYFTDVMFCMNCLFPLFKIKFIE
ncbi:hypothetical protein KM622_gp110 [Spodoptera exempta nucleopolyhedrovirus]|uniref:Ac52 n=1 Tax=Spodoptera exempta nucleopolyhedrovirus TaxID=1242863 RepID=A0A410S7U6_9ABAC|nr:hypothetical protein KM622_gp110 [Spodoptera exempta nucleopolyhedrovirus]QAT90396.1 hypothetical protein [Spodoptera exempta nucleopolyhedrovirus]